MSKMPDFNIYLDSGALRNRITSCLEGFGIEVDSTVELVRDESSKNLLYIKFNGEYLDTINIMDFVKTKPLYAHNGDEL